MADGTELKPMVIFKWRTAPKIKFPPEIFMRSGGWTRTV
jgi:hypothetical protein